MIAEEIISELKEEFKDDELMSEMIKSYFGEGSTDLKALVDAFVEGKIGEVDKS